MGNLQSLTDVERLMTRRDSLSGTYDVILTYAMSHLMPRHIVSELALDSGNNLLNDLTRVALRAYSNFQEGKLECMKLNSGSTAEGLSILQFHVAESGTLSIEAADVDVLVIDNYYFSTTPENAILNKCDGYIDTSKTNPGFARLRVVNTEKLPKELLAKRMCNGEEVYYLSKYLLESLRENTLKSGPAATTESTGDVIVQSNDLSKEFLGESSVDIVYAVNLTEWPDFMETWQSRQTEVSFLKMVLDNNYGSYLVGAAHPRSEDPDIEWRISLSLPELVLARELNVVQRQAYLVFKYLVKETIKGQKGIVTYHLKTTLFWTIEKTPRDMWCEENLAQCLYQLFDNFIDFLGKKNLPNYFITESNLLGNVPADHLRTTLCSLLKLREDPLGYLLKYQRRVRLQGHSIWWDHALADTLLPHLQTANNILFQYKSYPSSSLLFLRRCLFESIVDVVATKVSEGDFMDPHEMMMTYLRWPSSLRPEPADIPFEDLLYNFLVHVCRKSFELSGNVNIGISFATLVRKRLGGSPEMTTPLHLRLTLFEACWSGLIARYSDDAQDAEQHLDQSALVLDQFNLHKDDVITIAEYSCFFLLLWCRRFKKQVDQSQIKKASNSIKVIYTLVLALEITDSPNEYQFCGIWKLLCSDMDVLEPNLNVFLESTLRCYVPHEIIALLANILIIRKLLLPNIDGVLLKTRLECHCDNGGASKPCAHEAKVKDLRSYRECVCTMLGSAEKLLYAVVMVFDARIMKLDFHAPGNRQMSKMCVKFLLVLAMMYGQCWDGAATVLFSICSQSLPTDHILSYFLNICLLSIAYAHYNEKPFRKALLPLSAFVNSRNLQSLTILEEILASVPLTCTESNDSDCMQNRVVQQFQPNPLTLKVKYHEEPIEVEVHAGEITIKDQNTSRSYPYDIVNDNVTEIFQQFFNDCSPHYRDFSGSSQRQIIEELSTRLNSLTSSNSKENCDMLTHP